MIVSQHAVSYVTTYHVVAMFTATIFEFRI